MNIFHLTFFNLVLDGGIAIVEMYYRRNLLALVGGGKNPKFTPNKVVIWDDFQTKVLNEFKYTSLVKNVKLKKDKIIVVCDQRIYVYNLTTYKQIETIETCNNPRGVIAVNTDQDFTILAYPEVQKGFMKIKDYEKSKEISINAHDNTITFISISCKRLFVATACEKGDTLRIFNGGDGSFLMEFKRGNANPEFDFITFDPDNHYLAAASERGNILIWSLSGCYSTLTLKGEISSKDIPAKLPQNSSYFWSFLPGVSKSEVSLIKIKINDDKSICGFLPNNQMLIVGSVGKYYIMAIDYEAKKYKINVEDHLNVKYK
jgi:WD40 repeat protein